MRIFKKIGLSMFGALSLFTMSMSAQAAVYNVADYMPLLNTTASDERVYMEENIDPYAAAPTSTTIYFERSGGVLPARVLPTDTNAATVATNVIRQSSGRESLITVDVSGLTFHGEKSFDPIASQSGTNYDYDFIVSPASAATATLTDFTPANLTTPSAMLPAVTDTAVQTQFTRSYASTGESTYGAWADYVTETVTVDDNAGLLHDLSNPAHPDYDAQLVFMWDVANGGSGLGILQGLLKVTIHTVNTSVTDPWSDVNDTVLYLSPGVGEVYSKSTSATWPATQTQRLFGYNVAALSGSVGGTGVATIQVQDMYGNPSSGGYVNAQMNNIDPYTGLVTTDYSALSVYEETPGSGLYKVYFGAGDLLDVNYKGNGYMQEVAPVQDLYTMALASAPAPLVYSLSIPLGTVSGIVSDPAGLPLPGVTVELTDAYANPYVWNQPVRAITDASGTYMANMDPYTTYNLSVPTRLDNYDGTTSPNLPVGLVGGIVDQYGQVVSGVLGAFSVQPAGVLPLNIQVAQGVVISGVVTDPAGLAVSGASINVNNLANPVWLNLNTDSYGQYTATVLLGQYDIQILEGWDPIAGQPLAFTNFGMGGFIDPYGMTTQNWNNRAVFNAVLGTNIVANAQLAVGGDITGVITDPLGLPVANAGVSLQGSGGSTGWGIRTDANGQYAARAAPGQYRVQISEGWDPTTGQLVALPNGGNAGYIDPYAMTTPDWNAANLFTVLAAGTTQANAQLSLLPTITGTVVDPYGLPVANAQVSLQGQLGGSGWVQTDVNGQYTANVVADQYRVQIFEGWDPATGQFAPFTNFGVGGFIDPYGMTTSNWSNAALFNAAGTVATVADVQLLQGGQLTGVVTDPLGLPVANAQVSLQGQLGGNGWAQTDVNGQYTARVAPDQYRVYINQGWDPATGTPVALPNGGAAGYIDPYAMTTSNWLAAKLFDVLPATNTQANVQLSLVPVVAGTVTNNSGVAGSILVDIFFDPYATTVAVPGVAADPVTLAFNILNVPDGTYWVAAYVDVNGNASPNGPDVNEPVTMSPVPVTITGGVVSPTSVNVVIDVVVDSDGDGVGDFWDLYPTNPNFALEPDTDGDGIADLWEIQYFGDLTTANQFTDANGNGILDIQEFTAGANPVAAALNPSFIGTDAAGPIMSVVDSTGVAVQAPVGFFNASVVVLGSTPIDIDGDGINEYAVVAQRTDNLIMCQVRRANGVLVKAFFVTTSSQASVLNVYAAQMDAVAGDELVIGKVRLVDNQPVVTVHNPSTGTKVMETFMFNGNWTASNFFAVDVNGDGIQEVALGGVKLNGLAPVIFPTNRPGVQIRNADGSMSSYVFPMSKNFTGLKYARIDRNGDGVDEVVALGKNINNRWIVQILNAATSATLSVNVILNSPYNPVSLLTGNVDGVAGDEVVIAASLNSNGRAMFDIRNGTSNARINLLYMQPAATAPDQYALSDWNGDGVQDLMVRGTNAAIPSYLIKRSDNTIVYSGMPVGISGINDRYSGGM